MTPSLLFLPSAKWLVICFLLVALHSGTSEGSDWHYGDESHWPPICNEGRKQSPIALSPSIADEKEFTAFIFERYDAQYPVRLQNNGHSAEIRLQVQDQPSVKGGGLPHIFLLDHLHFHWQSEHTINNYRFPLEMHMVHYASVYKSVSEALRYRDGVAVLSILFDLSPDDDTEFEPLIALIDKLHDKVGTYEQTTFNIEDYMPRDVAGFYRYNGSLTTPDCTEGVLWTIFTNTLPISLNQVKSFALLQTKDHKELPHNYRPLQDLNGRRVFLKTSPIRNSGHRVVQNLFVLSTVFIIVLYWSSFF